MALDMSASIGNTAARSVAAAEGRKTDGTRHERINSQYCRKIRRSRYPRAGDDGDTNAVAVATGRSTAVMPR
jgi:hypothetical protein